MDIVEIVIGLFLFALGAVVGSFLNVVIYRLPRGESVVGLKSSSHCPRCGRALKPGDLVPLFSWLLLKGRCRSCGIRISPRYFGIELLTALLFTAAGATEHFWPTLGLLHKILIIALFIPIFFIDQDHKIVPDDLSVPLLLMGFAWNIIEAFSGHTWLVTLHGNSFESSPPTSLDVTLPTSIVFACACAGIFWLIQWFGEVAFKKEAMGLGDVNIAAGIGANLPILYSLCSFAIAIGVGAIIGSALLLLRKGDKSGQMAFGPMLVTGALVMLLWPDLILHLVASYRASMGG